MPVRVEQLVVELTGSAQQLSPVELRLREVMVQPRSTNLNPIYFGASAVISATNYGVRIPAPVTSLPPAPFLIGEFEDGSVKLGDFYVIGTAGEFLHVLYVRFI